MIQPFLPETSHNGAVEESYERSHTAAQQPDSIYPTEEPSYTSEENFYPLAQAEPYTREEQFPQTYPVPMYSLMNSLAATSSQPLGMPGLSQVHYTAASPIPRSLSNTGQVTFLEKDDCVS